MKCSYNGCGEPGVADIFVLADFGIQHMVDVKVGLCANHRDFLTERSGYSDIVSKLWEEIHYEVGPDGGTARIVQLEGKYTRMDQFKDWFYESKAPTGVIVLGVSFLIGVLLATIGTYGWMALS